MPTPSPGPGTHPAYTYLDVTILFIIAVFILSTAWITPAIVRRWQTRREAQRGLRDMTTWLHHHH